MAPSSNDKSPRHRFWFGLSGSSPITAMAVVAIVTVVMCLAMSGWWASHIGGKIAQSAREREVEAIGSALALSAKTLLSANDLDGLAQQVTEAGQRFKLNTCRITLPDGSIVADIDASHVTVRTLAATWSQQTISATHKVQGRTIALDFPVVIKDRGAARLSITAPRDVPISTLRHILTVMGGIGVVAVTMLLVIMRLFIKRWAPLDMVREALVAINHGEDAQGALAVDEELGPEAQGWNKLLAEHAHLHKQLISQQTTDLLAARGQSSGDLESACDAMWQGLIVVNRQMRVKYVNGAAAVLLQSKRETLVGAGIDQFIEDPDVIESLHGSVNGASAQRHTFEIERKAGGNQSEAGMLRISIRPVRRNDPAAVIIVIEDITQLRTAEDASHAFVTQVTHELRTPLTNIRLYLETLMENENLDPGMRAKSLNVINQESLRLERIVGDMLSVSEIEAGSYQIVRDDVRVELLFEDLARDYQAHADDKQIDLIFKIAPKLPVLSGDRDKILLAFHNLVGNALKYTPSGGQVVVNIEADESQVTVSVKDTGIGISEEDQQLVFDKFYRARDKRVSAVTGSGLGLALAREVIRLHGGEITVESRIDEGSTFTLTLPVRAKAA